MTAQSLTDVFALLEGWGDNWILAKGQLTDAEPPYGCQLLAGDEVVAEGEGETALAAVEAAFNENGFAQ